MSLASNMDVLARGLGSLGTNPPLGVESALSVHGSDWLWAVTAIYIASFVSTTPRLLTFVRC